MTYSEFRKTQQSFLSSNGTLKYIDKDDDFLIFDKMKDKVSEFVTSTEEYIHLIDAKHFIQEEQPKQINRFILDFLS